MKEPFDGEKQREPPWWEGAFTSATFRTRTTAQDFLVYSVGTGLVILGVFVMVLLGMLLVWVGSLLW